MKRIIFILLLNFWAMFSLLSQVKDSQTNQYLGEKPPAKSPKVFAPGVISLENQSEFGSVFNKDVTEFYYGVDIDGKAEIRYSILENGSWTSPKKLLSNNKYSYNDPFLSPDENRLYFISNSPSTSKNTNETYDIWYIERTKSGWNTNPKNAGNMINSLENEYYMSFSNNGSMYFSSNANAKKGKARDFDIYSSSFEKGTFQKPLSLGPAINSNAYEADVFVSPDESYLIFCSARPEGFGQGDLYISFKLENGEWSEAKNMGNIINSSAHELCPFVTHDGQYLFYTSNQDIYWISTNVIHQLRN